MLFIPEQFPDEDPDLVLLVNIVDLLSVCAEDKCQSAKHFCRMIFSVHELLRYIIATILYVYSMSFSIYHAECLQLQM